jgi:hypothetical protein
MPVALIAKRAWCSERTVIRYKANILRWGTVLKAEPLRRGADPLITVEMGEVCRIRSEKD